jgi:Arc/MetJ family transcription regulator
MDKLKKKTWILDQSLITRVRKIYKTRTETEAVSKALRDVVVREKIRRAFQTTAGKSPGIEEVF